jgi:hypothetical protein
MQIYTYIYIYIYIYERTYIHLNTYITRPVGRCSPPHVVLSWGNSNGQNKSVMHIFVHD